MRFETPAAATVPLADQAATEALAARLAAEARPGDALLLAGPLGAGKSAFARAFLRGWTGDPRLEVPSPSYTLVQGYARADGAEATHFDLYRLAGPTGLEELGWDDARRGIVLVEWPDRLGAFAPADALTLRLDFAAAPGARHATLAGWPGRLS